MDAQRRMTAAGQGRGQTADASSSLSGSASPEQAAEYIAVMTAELHKLAMAHDLLIIGYLLDMARVEADTTARSLRSGSAGKTP